jgi:hypothetical protein
MKKRRRKHSVRCQMQVLELTKAGSSMQFEIFASDEIIDRIVIGRGSFTWYGRNRQKGKELSWTRFAAMMDRYSYE